MEIVIKVIGVVFVALGILYLYRPAIIKTLLGFFGKGKRLYIAGLIRLVLAVVFLLGARECHISRLIFALGILFLLSGILIFAMGPGKLKPIIEWYQKRSINVLRLIAMVPIVLGGLIIYAA